MQIELWLIRHGKTPGNACGRYVGRTDEGLEPEEKNRLACIREKGIYPGNAVVCVSPMKRCRQTAAVLFPGREQYIADGLQECDFGAFEYKNYEELNGREDYQAWIDSGGTGGFPGGESMDRFCGRVTAAFEKMVSDMITGQLSCGSQMALVCHGGTIMAVMAAFGDPGRDYFAWQVRNGCGYRVLLDTQKWSAGEHRLVLQSEVAV